MLEWPIASRKLAGLASPDFADWRDWRLKKVAPSTVVREKNLLHSVLESARRDWRWIRENPMKDVRWPATPNGRRRGITQGEIDAIAEAFGLDETLSADTATKRVGLAFLFAIETAMRSGEICAMEWAHVHLAQQYVTLPKTKNGDERDVPLSTRAVEIIQSIPRSDGPVFGLDDGARDALWRKVRDTTPHNDIHFHDTRSEAISRLSKRLDVLELARVIGHRDLKSLLHYYNASAADMAKRLG
jgi:integrase